MKTRFFFLLMLSSSLLISAQEKKSRFNLEVNYGLNGNFFVRSYDETQHPELETNFYKKDFLGTISGVELSYNLNPKSSLFLGYSRSINKGEKDYYGIFNGVYIDIYHFNIRFIDGFYQLGYERSIIKNTPSWKYQAGFVYVRTEDQSIHLYNYDNTIEISESDFKHSNAEEAGVFAGLSFSKKIDTRFEAGLKLRGYYLISVNTFEAITVTPTLKYNF